VLLITGCASQKMNLYTRTTNTTPVLAGKTVAVFPPLTVGGGESRITMDADPTINTVFTGDIAGIHFKTPQSLKKSLQEKPVAFLELSHKITQGLPAHIQVEGEEKTVFDSKTVAGKKRDKSYVLKLKAAATTAELTPKQLDFSMINAIDSDYVLISVPFNILVKNTRFLTLGLIPIAGYGTMSCSPQGVFALYELKTGQKVWEGQIGTYTSGDSPAPVSDIILGAAYLITGDIEVPLDRTLTKIEPKK
jgi:hypothetical protein